MEQFASGWKRSYYGKGDVIAYRLNRDGHVPNEQSPVFGANVLMLVYGETFWRTYTEGDNSGLVATDSMKNFIQRETMNFAGDALSDYCHFLAATFVNKYAQVEGVQVSAVEIPYRPVNGQVAFAPAGPERATARVELSRSAVVEATCGIRGFKLLRLGGSAFHGFVRDEYTTLPEAHDRPLFVHMNVGWTNADLSRCAPSEDIRDVAISTFCDVDSASIQELVYQIGVRVLASFEQIASVDFYAENRLWDTAQTGDGASVYTDARPPFGVITLTLER